MTVLIVCSFFFSDMSYFVILFICFIFSYFRYELFCDSVDRIVENAATVRTVLGIPDREPDDIPEETSMYAIALDNPHRT